MTCKLNVRSELVTVFCFFLFYKCRSSLLSDVAGLDFETHKIVRVKWSSVSKPTPIQTIARQLGETIFNETYDTKASSPSDHTKNTPHDDGESDEELKARFLVLRPTFIDSAPNHWLRSCRTS